MADVGPRGDAASDREYTLSQSQKDLRLNLPTGNSKRPDIWGVVMDVHHKDRLLTIVAYADGSARLITTNWAESYDSAGHPLVVRTSKRSAHLANSNLAFFSPASNHSPPPVGYLKIFVLASPSLLSSQNYPIEEISVKGHPLYDLYCTLHDVGTAMLLEPQM